MSIFKNYEDFEAQKIKCRACPIGKVYDCVVPSDGNKKNPTLLIIGEAAGANEVEERKPFVGKAGKLLRGTLDETGFKIEDYLITNVVPCRPENNKFPTDKSIVYSCRNKWLKNEILLTKPQYVLLIGAKPMFYCLGLDKITKRRGEIYSKKIGDTKMKVMPILHPSYVLRKQYGAEGKAIVQSFKDDIKKMYDLIYT